jgi:energy-coupling factor transporter transmembrane protein EcfT
MLSGIFIFSTFFFYIYWNFLSNNLKLIGIFLWLFQSVIYLITSLINPGTPTPEYYLENYDLNKTKVGTFRICSKCKLIMDLSKGTEHCPDCDICIMGIDHQCPWTSKCIGKNNLYFFYAFLGSTLSLIIYLMISFMSIFAIKNHN